MTDEERAADAECRAHYGPALDGFTYVPEAQATKEVGPYIDPLAATKREAMILAKELGKIQTGQKVDAAWAFRCLEIIGEEALGEVRWSITNETHPEPLRQVIEMVKHQIVLATGKAATLEGACF